MFVAMPRGHPMPAEVDPPGREALGERLRQLLELVNDTLAFAGTTPLAGGLTMSMVDTSASVHRVAHQRPRPAPGPRVEGDTGPASASDREPGAAAGGRIEDEHVETWRLVERAQQGDGEAFGQLYDRYFDTVYRFIYFRVNDRTLAEDFTSETFLRALRRISTISYQGRDIGAWFITIARNIVLDHVKSARNRLEITTAD